MSAPPSSAWNAEARPSATLPSKAIPTVMSTTQDNDQLTTAHREMFNAMLAARTDRLNLLVTTNTR
jgi:hypothetical protein